MNVLALALDETHFREAVSEELYQDGFLIIDWGEVSPFNFAENDWHEDYMAELHAHLCEEHPVQYSEFHTYPKEGLDG